jgi:hypothetical protein
MDNIFVKNSMIIFVQNFVVLLRNRNIGVKYVELSPEHRGVF